MRPILSACAAILAVCFETGAASAREVPARWGPYAVDAVDESGRVLPVFEHRGRTYVLGALGQRYLLRVRNGSDRRIEVVASVDGRDVVDGRPAAFDKRGYIVAPHGEVVIDGYRLSSTSVAAFRFSTVPRSYAARKGDARDVGVVGVAIFPERWAAYVPRYPPYPTPEPYPFHEREPSGEREQRGKKNGERGESGRSESYGGAAPPSAADAPLADGAPHAKPGFAPERRERPGLGTEFGEEHESRVEQVSFVRASSRPEAVLTLRYDDRQGLLALGIDVDGDRWAQGEERWLRETARPFRSEPGYCDPPPGWRR